MRPYNWTIIYSILLLIASSCSYDFPEDDEVFTFGNADFGNFITIGDYYTAGYMNGALYIDGQRNSFPAIVSRQLQSIQPSLFIQTDILSQNGYNWAASDNDNIKGKYVYRFLNKDILKPIIIALDGEIPGMYSPEGQINNWGIPGIKSFEIALSGFSGNIYYDRLSDLTDSESLIENATYSDVSFFSLFIGLPDILGYALAGGVGDPNPLPGAENIEVEDLTPFVTFEESIQYILGLLLSAPNAKGIVSNIPDITDFAYFNTIPWNSYVFYLSDFNYDDFDAMFDFYKDFNDAVEIHNLSSPVEQHRPFIKFPIIQGSLRQPLVIEDENLSDATFPNGSPLPKIRLITSEEKVLMNIPEIDINGFGYVEPVPDDYILTSDEISSMRLRTQQYNVLIEQLVNEIPNTLAMMDLHLIFYDLQLSSIIDEFGQLVFPDKLIIEEGIPMTFNLGIDGFFSLDGITPNQKGNAFIANHFISVIKESFNANIPLVNINKYKGNTYANQF